MTPHARAYPPMAYRSRRGNMQALVAVVAPPLYLGASACGTLARWLGLLALLGALFGAWAHDGGLAHGLGRLDTRLGANTPGPMRADWQPAAPEALKLRLSRQPQTAATPPALLFEAVELHRRGRLDAAEALYRLATADSGIQAHIGLARILALRSSAVAAAEYLAQQAALAPHPALHAEAGRWWAAAGEHARARTHLLEAGDNLDAETRALLASLHLLAGDHAAAIEAYRTALQSQPQRPAWWLGLAVALYANGAHEAARAALDRAESSAGLPPQLVTEVRTWFDQG